MIQKKLDGFGIAWEELKTPCYVIDQKEFYENCQRIMTAFKNEWGSNMEYGYSIKTNHHEALMQMARKMGWKMEAVSEDEVRHAGKISHSYRDIIYNGPVKGESIYSVCKEGGIVNVDNLEELDCICEFLSNNKGTDSRQQIGLRVNFDIASRCQGEIDPEIETGRFGLSYENGDLEKAISILRNNGIALQGLHMHTSTISRSANIFKELAAMVCNLKKEYGLNLKYIDMGGGFFGGGKQVLPGRASMEEYAQTICSTLKECFEPEQTKLLLEPGASVIATAVRYYTRVCNIREIRGTKIITLDGTLLHINPFMAKRNPAYEFCEEKERKKCGKQIVCGCTCMEKDRFFELENADKLDTGECLCFKNTGAYTMAFNSSFIIKPPVVYVWNNESGNLLEWKE